MTDRWEEISRIVTEALSQPDTRRQEFLREASAGDDQLLAELVSVLAEAEETEDGTFFHPPQALKELGRADAAAGGALEESGGATLADFELLEQIGVGAMGVVYRARQKSLERDVALKKLQLHASWSAKGVERFRLEATATARMNHPNIVKVYVVGYDAVEGTHFFAMEFVPGASLRDVLEAIRGQDRGQAAGDLAELMAPLEAGYPARVSRLVAAVADALQHSHEHGIIHRDVKPGNILLDVDGKPRVVDFGVAKDLKLESLLMTDHAVGTPYYMSPEQAQIETTQLDERTDVYSLGVVLYELLTRSRPFEGLTRDSVLEAIRHDDPPRIEVVNPNVPRDLRIVCMKALAKDRDKRYLSARDFADDLRRFLGYQPIHARPPTRVERAVRWVRRRRLPVAASLLVALSVMFTAGVIQSNARDDARELLLAPLTPLMALDDAALAAAPLQQLVDGRADIAELLAGDYDIDPVTTAALGALDGRIRTFAHEARDDAEALLASVPSLSVWDAHGALQEGIGLLMTASTLLPEDQLTAELAQAEQWYPRLTVTTDPPGADVFLTPMDPLTYVLGERRQLDGQTPLEALPVRMGAYRLTAVIDGLGFGEADVELVTLRDSYDVTLMIRPTVDVVTDGVPMVRIPAGRVTIEVNEFMSDPPIAPGVVQVAEFWIDRDEVTFAEYSAFTEATGHRPPRLFDGDHDGEWDDTYDPAFDELPVVLVDFDDATAYARWVGKRLPTLPEWLRAARGAEGFRYPWGNDGDAVEDRAVLWRLALTDRSGGPYFGWLHEKLPEVLEPGTTPLDDISPFGVHHLMGNVRELTSTLQLTSSGRDSAQPLLGSRVHLGSAWSKRSAGLSDLRRFGTGFDTTLEDCLGFRCAKGTTP